MPRRDDELDDEDDRPRRRRDEDDDRPARSRRDRDDEDDERAPPPGKKKSATGLVIGILVGVFLVCCGGGGYLVYYVVTSVKKGVEQIGNTVAEAGETNVSRMNLVQIGSAAHKYHDTMGTLPNNSYEVKGPNSRPLLSWRVHLLPYLGEDALYKQFKLDEPWDGPTNIKLLTQMPNVYGSTEARKKAGANKTFYRGFSGPRGLMEKPAAPGQQPAKITFAGISDGTINTILVIDAGEAVEWTKPDDLDFSPGKPRPALGGAYPNFPLVLVLTADGTVRNMRRDVPDDTLRKLIDRADGAPPPIGWEQ